MTAVADERQVLRAAATVVRSYAPDWHFAASFLPRPQRRDALVLGAVLGQLHQVATYHEEHACAEGQCSGSGREGCQSAGGGGCGENSCGESGCGGDQRLAVCQAIAAHLLAGEPTGRPELDAFAALAARVGITAEDLEPMYAQLLEDEHTARWATWSRLRGALWRGAGSVGVLMLRSLGQPSDSQWRDTQLEQARAWASGMALIARLEKIGEIWRRESRLVLPLDDLVRCRVSESQVARWSEQGHVDAAHADAWGAIMANQAERAGNLLLGGWGAWSSSSRGVQRAVAIYTQGWRLRLAALGAGRLNCFATNPTSTRKTFRVKQILAARQLLRRPSAAR